MLESTGGKVAVALSSLASAWLVWRLWRSEENLFFKVTLSAVAFIPFFGPLMVFFYGVPLPRPQPTSLQDLEPKRADVYDRWRHVLEERNPVKKFRLWRERIKDDENL